MARAEAGGIFRDSVERSARERDRVKASDNVKPMYEVGREVSGEQAAAAAAFPLEGRARKRGVRQKERERESFAPLALSPLSRGRGRRHETHHYGRSLHK